jgi:hypothetical protein
LLEKETEEEEGDGRSSWISGKGWQGVWGRMIGIGYWIYKESLESDGNEVGDCWFSTTPITVVSLPKLTGLSTNIMPGRLSSVPLPTSFECLTDHVSSGISICGCSC